MRDTHNLGARRLFAACFLGFAVTSCEDAIAPIVPTSVTLDVSSIAFASLGDTEQLGATIRDQSGQPIGSVERSWTSSSEAVATVSATGLVTAVGNGSTVVTVASGSANASVSITVRQIAALMTLSLDAWSFSSLADTLRLSATVEDAGGSAIPDAVVAWASVDTLVATVSATGLVTANSNGSTAVTAIVDGVVETATMTVDQIAGAIALSADSLQFVSLGDTASFAAMVTDAAGNDFVAAQVMWSISDANVATVSTSGLVTAVGNGVVTVSVTSGLVLYDATVTVAQAVTSLALSPDSLVLRDPGDAVSLSAVPLDALGSVVPGASVVWASDDAAVATVNASGLVTAVATGVAAISAVSAGRADTILARVEPELTLMGEGPGVVVAEVVTEVSLSARVEDLLGTAYSGSTVSWSTGAGSGSISSDVETVSGGTGHVGALWMLGTAGGTQRAFASLQSRGLTVTVEFLATATAGPATSAVLVADSVLLSANGETVFLGPTFADAYGNATTGAGVVWSTGDPGVATVGADGLVSGVGAGATYVTASLGAPVDSILVTVEMRGAITITFDDGWLTTYDNAWPIFQDLGLPANVGVYTGAVTGGFPDYMNQAQLDELHAAGWSMVSHTVDHDSLTQITGTALDYQLRASQQWLLDRGYNGSNILIAPYHDFGLTERIAASAYYIAARGFSATSVVPDSLVQWRPSLPYELTGLEADLLPYTTLAGRNVLRAILQRTKDEGAFIDVFFHKVEVADSAALRETLMIFDEFRDRVLPYHELYPLFARPVG